MALNKHNTFYDLSVAMTGFDRLELLASGVGREYLDELVRRAGERNIDDLLSLAARLLDAHHGDEPGTMSALRERLWDDERFGPLVRNIVKMWYLATWNPLPESWQTKFGDPSHRSGDQETPHVVSAAAYQEGLVWRAMGVHPRGAKPPGYGSWALKPDK